MAEEGYSIKEMIQEFRADVSQRLDGIQDRVDKTNGRVKSLEIRNATLTGGIAVISLIVIPLLVYIWNDYRDKIDYISEIRSEAQEFTSE